MGRFFVDHLFDYVTLLSGKQQGTENKFRTCVSIRFLKYRRLKQPKKSGLLFGRFEG